MSTSLQGWWLGRHAYGPVHELQQRLHRDRQQGRVGDTVLFVEHDPVITLGRGAQSRHVLVARETLAARGIDWAETGRGGDVTLHAPGQLVAYPILQLAADRRDVRRYVGALVRSMQRLAREWGIESGPVDGLVGLWVDEQAPQRWEGAAQAARLAKLGAVGVRISRWVTMHGFAFNLTTDLELYRLIVPCGITQHGVTSVRALTGRTPSVRQASALALGGLSEELGFAGAQWEDRATHPLKRVGP